jgi:preprotein translocase subunit YajC
MVEGARVGDQVVTIGGMHGTVERKGEGTFDLKVAEGTIITFNLNAISQVVRDDMPADQA